MKAAEVSRQMAKKAAESEIVNIDIQISNESRKGNTRITISGISQGARAYLEDEGYEINEICFPGTFSQFVITW